MPTFWEKGSSGHLDSGVSAPSVDVRAAVASADLRGMAAAEFSNSDVQGPEGTYISTSGTKTARFVIVIVTTRSAKP